jgi:hypothetical protein
MVSIRSAGAGVSVVDRDANKRIVTHMPFVAAHQSCSDVFMCGRAGSSSMQDAGDQYLQREVAEARDLIAKLGRKTDGVQSFREKSSKMLEEAHRAMGRLEQVGTSLIS